MTYDQFKKEVLQLAKKQKVLHMCPGNNFLFALWEKKTSPEEVVNSHCTKEAQKERHQPENRM